MNALLQNFRYKISLIFVLVILSTQYSQGQKSNSFTINWESHEEVNYLGEIIKVPSIQGQNLDGNIPNVFITKNIKSASKAAIVVTQKEVAPVVDVEYLTKFQIEVGGLKYSSSYSKMNGMLSLRIDLFPYVKQNNVIYRILEVQIKSIPINNSSIQKQNKDFASSSVLASGSGDWYKIEVKKDGIYKIDKQFLENLGIDISSLDPQDINIYGNGDGRLPELNSSPRTDDLAKNAIYIEGELDGVFDDNDYILFYGWGPDRWYLQDSIFNRDKHIYSDVSCYFINVNNANTPLRVQAVNNSALPITDVIDNYCYYDIHELESRNLLKGGQRWYGELFDSELIRTFTFQVPSIVTGINSRVIVSNASTSDSWSNTQSISVSGINLLTSPLKTSASEYTRNVNEAFFTSSNSNIPVTISISRISPDVITYLDNIVLNTRRNLALDVDQFNFRDTTSIGIGNVTEFELTNFSSSSFVWDVSNRHEPFIVKGNLSGSDYSLIVETDSLREFVASNGVDFFEPTIPNDYQVEHQNLHALTQADYLIVTNPQFLAQAQRLAGLHQQNDGMSVHVVTTDQVYNEFSSGMQDATAIRTFAKMFYDRAEVIGSAYPKYLLLFGDGIYDPKERVSQTNFFLTYQMLNSEDHIWATPTDDYFGILEDNESIASTNTIDIGVGRILASTDKNAKEQVDKIEHYMMNGSDLYQTVGNNCCNTTASNTFGDWRTRYVQIADDEEGNWFIDNDVEAHYAYVSDSCPEMNCEKIYLDAYQQVTTAGGERYPEVNSAIDRAIQNGALVMNYVGHGGEVGLAEERVITIPQIDSWSNINNLPLFVSATCEFTKYDDPERVSAGELVALNPSGGAVALMTTTRSIYFGTNTQIGVNFYKNVFKRDANLEPRRFGEIIMDTKNAVGGDNKRSFTLIGDPALQIALPRWKIVTDSINGMDPQIEMDTIMALSKVVIKGHIEDQFGTIITNYDGLLQPTVFDKPKEQITLSNDGAFSPPYTFYTQTNKLYKGQASIKDGYFEFTFIVPKDINYSIGKGKISYYGDNDLTDAYGSDTSFYIGGVDPNGIVDNVGPEIELYMNDESFVNGGLTDQSPMLFAKLYDDNGINTVGNGIGHDLVAYLDGETSDPIVLNDYYTADVDSYQSGELRYELIDLAPGNHTLTLKAWDVNNNSSEITIEFIVQDNVNVELEHVLNYPNPFTTATKFYFEHNQVCDQLEAQIQIMTVSGRIVKTINQYVSTAGFRSEGIEWDGRDDFGDQLAKGVYIYRVIVTNPDGKKAEKIEKLVLLKQ